MTRARFLVLGGGTGWHARQLQEAAARHGCDLDFAPYETLTARLEDCDAGSGQQQGARGCNSGNLAAAASLSSYDAVLTRTMPAGTLEQITFRLSVLHDHQHDCDAIINPPRGLEIAIDKYATLAEVRRLGFPVPNTFVTQSRDDAFAAFKDLGSDCVVKPIFGGEGRGVMRIRDEELAWTAFSTLQSLGAIFYLQSFVPPGGRDLRLLVIGDEVHGIARVCHNEFRTNARRGSEAKRVELSESQRAMALDISSRIGLKFASVDLLDGEDGVQRVLEVNAVPGWRASQQVLDINIADQLIDLLRQESAGVAARASG